MTRDEAERALEIARNALREVGLDPMLVTVDPDPVYEWRLTLWYEVGRTPRVDVWRAGAIGVAAVTPDVPIWCSDHAWDPGAQDRCPKIPATEAGRGVTSCQEVPA